MITFQESGPQRAQTDIRYIAEDHYFRTSYPESNDPKDVGWLGFDTMALEVSVSSGLVLGLSGYSPQQSWGSFIDGPQEAKQCSLRAVSDDRDEWLEPGETLSICRSPVTAAKWSEGVFWAVRQNDGSPLSFFEPVPRLYLGLGSDLQIWVVAVNMLPSELPELSKPGSR